MATHPDDGGKAHEAGNAHSTEIELCHIDTETSQMGHLTNEEDHQETILQSLQRHPWPTLWCAYGVWVILATAFDFAAPSAVTGIPEFRKDFGSAYDGNHALPAKWQSAYSGAPVASRCIGSFVTGYLGEKIGKKLMLLIGFSLSSLFIGGFSIGIGLTTTFSYIGEIAPVAIRGILTGASAVTFVLAQLIVALIVNYEGSQPTRWAYRGLFLGQYVITAIALDILPFMPESPYWLVARGKEEKAARSLKRLGYSSWNIAKRLANIRITLEEAKDETSRSSYLECFKKSNLHRTMVAVLPICIQNLGGAYFIMGYLVYYAQLSGNELQDRNCRPTFERVGRRPLNLYGTGLLTVILWICGGLASKTDSPSCLRGAISMFMIYLAVYNATIGSTAYTALSEVATPRLRIMTAAIDVILQNAIVCVPTFVIPYIFNPDQANLGGKTVFIFGGFSILSTVYMYFCHPETAGRSFEEIDEMFVKRVPARKFAIYETEAELRGKTDREELEGKS
ncbi:uncharacterized protein Z518_02095 [Rhinocladiella mackenziei CBS 650.93]|uniref:Major facilitator superfamily (MFS) profile domain-containing protein n=1 Tax=Rhinocladiella mackenziei CBS 650.93 TaxID=1442369 RepID=A0A0D2FYT0_9EURO|nr:uncharacterized protein Z518_02095 [Rhinocladiella mackenziei CBS 650.93]KIX07442.1 hypothetical protein Z518_02095 [Rhinocladiella mackenziei CBS 650.93]